MSSASEEGGRTKEGTGERRVTATTGRGATLTRVTGTMLKGWTRAAGTLRYMIGSSTAQNVAHSTHTELFQKEEEEQNTPEQMGTCRLRWKKFGEATLPNLRNWMVRPTLRSRQQSGKQL